MGSEGIRRRKPATRHAPPHDEGPSIGEPPVMWPSAGSGFEADPFSPAGTAEREWGLIQGMGRTRLGRVVAGALAAVMIATVVVVPLVRIFHR